MRKTGGGGFSYEMWERGREGREQVGTGKGGGSATLLVFAVLLVFAMMEA